MGGREKYLSEKKKKKFTSYFRGEGRAAGRRLTKLNKRKKSFSGKLSLEQQKELGEINKEIKAIRAKHE